VLRSAGHEQWQNPQLSYSADVKSPRPPDGPVVLVRFDATGLWVGHRNGTPKNRMRHDEGDVRTSILVFRLWIVGNLMYLAERRCHVPKHA